MLVPLSQIRTQLSAMDAPVRFLSLNRHLLVKTTRSSPVICCRFSKPYVSCRYSNPNQFRFSLPFSSLSANPSKFFHSKSPNSQPTDGEFSWSQKPGRVVAGGEGNAVSHGGEKCEVKVVLLGWLGSKTKHLKRYVEWYKSRGFDAVTFVTDVRETLRFDFGQRIDIRISELAGDLVSWVSERGSDGGERCLVFHTFSNTGWFAYGSILEIFLERNQDMMERIKGCVVDSGGAEPLSPQVFAAGFCAAILKKQSSIASRETSEQNMSSPQQKNDEPLVETILLQLLEKLFSAILKLPNVDQRLRKLESVLVRNQPCCPQLYLYSTADKVIPYRSIELFLEEQRRLGKEVRAFNFVSSPHVDHYRNFPEVYSSELENFLSVCFQKDPFKI